MGTTLLGSMGMRWLERLCCSAPGCWKRISSCTQASHAHLHAAPPFAALQVLVSQLGPDWEAQVASFDFQPMAAASIGQVGVLTVCRHTQRRGGN